MTPDRIRSVIAEVESRIGDGWPCWALSNHDVERCVTRWGSGVSDPDRFALVLIALLASLRGSVTLYQGEELGLPESAVPYSMMQDPFGLAFWPAYKGRDGCRTPIVWDSTPTGGFSDAEPWLPVDEQHRELCVSWQEDDPSSVLRRTRGLLRWRRQHPALLYGDIMLLEDTGDLLCWLRRSTHQTILVALNITGRRLTTPLHLQIRRVLHGHGFNGFQAESNLVVDPYQAFFATVVDPAAPAVITE